MQGSYCLQNNDFFGGWVGEKLWKRKNMLGGYRE